MTYIYGVAYDKHVEELERTIRIRKQMEAERNKRIKYMRICFGVVVAIVILMLLSL